ncbi:hypothetical protein JCM3766R1_002156 [Sporobolomyces carnicolor]
MGLASNNNNTQSIQSISVPQWTRVNAANNNNNSVVVYYTVAVSLPSRHYSIQHRYSEFVHLAELLSGSCGAPAPLELPPKHQPFKWFKSWSGGLTDQELELRREGLEKWLRAILSDRDPRWRSSRAFKQFVVNEQGDATSTTTTTKSESSLSSWTPTTWTREVEQIEEESRRLRRLVDERDRQLVENDHAAHQSHKRARESLVEIVKRLGDATKGLESLAREGHVTDGEIQRRTAIVDRLEGELEEIGRKCGNAPRIGTSSRSQQATGGRYDDDDEDANSVQRRALLGTTTKATTRVLGGGGAHQEVRETHETRPLDNEGVMQLQQRYLDDQDSKLDSLAMALRRQRHLGEMINQELALQEDVLDQLESGTDKVGNKIKAASNQIKRL